MLARFAIDVGDGNKASLCGSSDSRRPALGTRASEFPGTGATPPDYQDWSQRQKCRYFRPR